MYKKVVCIANNENRLFGLKTGSIYLADEHYNILDLKGDYITWLTEIEYNNNFITLSEYRERKIKEILNG